MTVSKTRDQLIVNSVVQAANNRPMTEKQRLFLAKHLDSAHLERIKTIRDASAQIRLVIADRKSPDEDSYFMREENEPSEAQVNLATKIGLDAQVVLSASSAELSEMIDERLAALGRQRDQTRALAATPLQIASLARMGYADGASLTRGQASDALSVLLKGFKKPSR